MKSGRGDDEMVAGTDRRTELGEADRVLLLALRTWTPGVRSSRDATPRGGGDRGPSLLERLEPSWAGRLQVAWNSGTDEAAAAPHDRAKAREQLRRAQRAEARVDPARVHPSWWIRALREESPAVRRVVVAAAPEPMRHAVQAGLLLDNDDVRSERPADPEVRAWALGLWTERLVGGEPDRIDDPPVIAAISRLSSRSGYRLCRLAGMIKLALVASEGPADSGGTRADWLREFVASAGPEFAVVARRDVESTPVSKLPRGRLPARVGLLTIARLLAECEPFRVRWALQQWPYTIAKLTRSLMPPATKRSTVISHIESEVLKTAWRRLNLEECVTTAWPGVD